MPDATLYTIDRLLDRRRALKGRGWQYRVLWEGYPLSDATWEPGDNLPPQMLADFDAANPPPPPPLSLPQKERIRAAAAGVYRRCVADGCRSLELTRGAVRLSFGVIVVHWLFFLLMRRCVPVCAVPAVSSAAVRVLFRGVHGAAPCGDSHRIDVVAFI
jgi:hypothetical protein